MPDQTPSPHRGYTNRRKSSTPRLRSCNKNCDSAHPLIFPRRRGVDDLHYQCKK